MGDHIKRAVAHAGAVAASHEDERVEYDDWQEYAVDPRDGR